MLEMSILIVNFNNKLLLNNCLNSIYETMPFKRSYEIIVVDNGSNDGSVNMVQKKFPKVILIKNKNKGYGHAMNQALKISKSKYVVLLNDDMYLCPNTLNDLFIFLEKNEKVGAVCCKILNPNLTLQVHDTSKFPATVKKLLLNIFLKKIFNKSFFKINLEDFDKIHKVDYVTGAACMIRMEVFQDIGLFDEQFFMFFEEIDLGYRLKKKGWETYYIPSKGIVHYGGVSSRQNPNPKIAEKYTLMCLKNMFLFYRKHYGFFSMFLLKCLQFLKYFIKFLSLQGKIILINKGKKEYKRDLKFVIAVLNLIIKRCKINSQVPSL